MTAAWRCPLGILLLTLVCSASVVEAQQGRVYRVGVVVQGGPYWAVVDGLRDGLRELGLEEGKQILFHVRELKGDLKAVEAAARSLEGEQVDLIFSVNTSVTIGVKRATRRVPIVFYAGSDPVAAGLVESYGKPGGRLTGVHSQATLLLAKRLELLKEMIPTLRRVVYFYNPDNPVGQQGALIAREAARQLKVQLIERPIRSVDELRAGLDGLRPGGADALLYLDGLVISQIEMILDAAGTIPSSVLARADEVVE